MILQGLSNARYLKRLTFKNNELGILTATEIGRMLLWPSPHHLEHITLQDLKCNVNALAVLFNFLKDNRALKTLRLKGLDLNQKKLISCLMKFFRLNTMTLMNLQISGSGLSS